MNQNITSAIHARAFQGYDSDALKLTELLLEQTLVVTDDILGFPLARLNAILPHRQRSIHLEQNIGSTSENGETLGSRFQSQYCD